ncbi:MAG: DUF1934 domain-containing protein [Lachnospiraceae bacterium]|nr:DUF1934 domain-containing protein [Lachnospiraceae bacterium]
MTKNCLVRISGHRDSPDIESPARYHKKDSGHFVFFERELDGITEKFSLRFGEDHLTYKRDGEVKAEVILEPGQMHRSDYITPYGTFEMGFDTVDFSFEETPSKIMIYAGYNMTLNGEPHEEGRIKVEITEVKI